ncbi:DUF6415 family natural product biosynthesis protein [Streptomyces buecherae]|uniref:DUF6415 family natural product biosynthesis protein n=1 Tax=Streptomyces buecherae TaxID=2763006 RepID=UPI0036BC5D90
MSTNKPPAIHLAPRERAVLQGLADGLLISEVARSLGISDGTADGYLRSARRRLHEVRDTPPAVAIAYAHAALDPPPPQDRKRLFLPHDRRYLVPLLAQGMTAPQISRNLSLPLEDVRQEAREALRGVGARNRAHFVKQAWAYRLLTTQHVLDWLRRADVTRQIEAVLARKTTGPDLPPQIATTNVIKNLTTYGLDVVTELETLCGDLPADSRAAGTALYTLAEAERRLHLPPPGPTPQAAMKRAQNLARLINALHGAIDSVTSEQAGGVRT